MSDAIVTINAEVSARVKLPNGREFGSARGSGHTPQTVQELRDELVTWCDQLQASIENEIAKARP